MLVAPGVREPAAVLVGKRRRAHDPVRVLAGDVGVQVDHLRLHPQAKLHAVAGDRIDERREALGPQTLVDVPVAEACVVVAAAAEPAVVEDEAFHAEPGGRIGEFQQGFEAVVKVDRLPGVEHHRADPPGRGVHVLRPGAEPVVEGLGDAVQATVGVGGEERRRPVAAAGVEHHFAGAEQLRGAEHAPAVGEAVEVLLVVAAPAEMRGPDLAPAVGEAGGPGCHQQRGIVAGPAVPAGADPGALLDGVPLRVVFAAPASGEVEQFRGVPRHRQHRGQFLELVRGRAAVGQRVRQLQEAAGVKGELGADVQSGLGIPVDDEDPAPAVLHLGGNHPQGRREVLAGAAVGVPVPAEARPSGPAGGGLREQPGGDGDVEGGVGDGPAEDRQIGEVVRRGRRPSGRSRPRRSRRPAGGWCRQNAGARGAWDSLSVVRKSGAGARDPGLGPRAPGAAVAGGDGFRGLLVERLTC